MKYRESGMPNEEQWSTYFEPSKILINLGVDRNINKLLDIGCGYGNFLIPAARMVSGSVTGFDIEQDMVNICNKKVLAENLHNVKLYCGDISDISYQNNIKEQFDFICLFNILHCENPIYLLTLANSLLTSTGKIGVIHWKRENTPRGPSMSIRPSPENIIDWSSEANLELIKSMELPPYHFGLVFRKK